MKTFTEFSTLVLRRAAAAKAAHASLEGDAFNEAMASALTVAADRVPRLMEALEIVGDQLDNLRLVRVYQGETGPHGAVSRGEFHYSLDRVAGQSRGRGRPEGGRGERGGRDGGRGGDRGGDRGGGDRGRDKPRGLGSLIKAAVGKQEDTKEDDRPQRGEIPRAGIGWQLTSAPRDDRGGPRGRKGPGGPGRGRPSRDAGGPGGPGGDERRRGPRPFGDRPRGPGGGGRPHGDRSHGDRPQGDRPQGDRPAQARPPRDPNAPRRERKPLGPDANGMGPDGKPWDPERKRKRDEERAARLSAAPAAEAAPPAEPAAGSEAATKDS